MSSPSHQVPTRAARQDPDAPLRVDLRIPFAACAVEGFLLLGLYTLLTYLKLPRLTLLGLVFLGVYALSVGVTFTAFAWRLSRSRRNIRTAELLTADIYRMFRSVMDIPYAVINGDNRVRVINAAMQSILGARSPVCDLPLSEICPAVTREQLLAALRNPGDGELPDLHSVPLPAGAEDGHAGGRPPLPRGAVPAPPAGGHLLPPALPRCQRLPELRGGDGPEPRRAGVYRAG